MMKAEILQTENIASSISTAKAKITHHFTPTVSEVVATRHEDTSPATHPPPVSPERHTREPVLLTYFLKLDLPQFSGTHSFGKHFGTVSRQLYTITHPWPESRN